MEHWFQFGNRRLHWLRAFGNHWHLPNVRTVMSAYKMSFSGHPRPFSPLPMTPCPIALTAMPLCHPSCLPDWSWRTRRHRRHCQRRNRSRRTSKLTPRPRWSSTSPPPHRQLALAATDARKDLGENPLTRLKSKLQICDLTPLGLNP